MYLPFLQKKSGKLNMSDPTEWWEERSFRIENQRNQQTPITEGGIPIFKVFQDGGWCLHAGVI